MKMCQKNGKQVQLHGVSTSKKAITHTSINFIFPFIAIVDMNHGRNSNCFQRYPDEVVYFATFSK